MNQILKKAAVWFAVLLLLPSAVQAAEDARQLVPLGQTIGVTLELGGVEVVDVVEFQDYDGKTHSPAEDAGIQAGDLILEINGRKLNNTKDLREAVNQNGATALQAKVRKDEAVEEVELTPAVSNTDGMLCLGVWVKDAASGIGTLTYYDPQTREFGALGHGICDPYTGDVIEIARGDILRATVVSVQKGSKGQPGELIGIFADGKERLGEIQANVSEGLKGTVLEDAGLGNTAEAVEVASRDEITEGPAYILANIEENNVEQFEVEIQKINPSESSSKSMVIKVTDQKLIEKTGGIVQGMSGSPIIQNGKLVGAVTHVFVNDPTRGYAICIENMLK